MSRLKTFGAFWYDLMVGDDWKIALSVVISLAGTTLLLTRTSVGDHVASVAGAAVVMLSFSLSLVVDVHERRRGAARDSDTVTS